MSLKEQSHDIDICQRRLCNLFATSITVWDKNTGLITDAFGFCADHQIRVLAVDATIYQKYHLMMMGG